MTATWWRSWWRGWRGRQCMRRSFCYADVVQVGFIGRYNAICAYVRDVKVACIFMCALSRTFYLTGMINFMACKDLSTYHFLIYHVLQTYFPPGIRSGIISTSLPKSPQFSVDVNHWRNWTLPFIYPSSLYISNACCDDLLSSLYRTVRVSATLVYFN